jgi:hypothetical protein
LSSFVFLFYFIHVGDVNFFFQHDL